MCSAIQPSSRAMAEAIRSAKHFLPEQRVAAVAGAIRPDLPGLGEVNDVLVVGRARPRHVLGAVLERHPHRVQAGDELAVAERVEGGLAHAGHDPHRDHHVGRVGELDAHVGDRRADRPHREGHHVHGAPAHRAARTARSSSRASRPGRASCWSGPASSSRGGADEGAVLDPRHVAGVGAGQVGVRPLGLREPLERARIDQLLAEAVVLLRRTRRTSGRRRAWSSSATRSTQASRVVFVVAAVVAWLIGADASSPCR